MTARLVFEHACSITGATSGFVTLLSASGRGNEVVAGDLLPHGHFPEGGPILCVPFEGDGDTQGLLGLAKPEGGFTARDEAQVRAFAKVAAQALRNAQRAAKLAARVEQLETKLSRIETLDGFVTICASCKQVRDDDGQWQQVESYVADHTNATFSHGVCDDCAQRLYGDEVKKSAFDTVSGSPKTVQT